MLGTVKLGAECITHIVSPWLWPHFAASCMSSCKKEREWGQSHLLIVTVFTPRYMCPYCRGIIFLILFRYFHAMYKYLCSILSNSYKQQNQKGMALWLMQLETLSIQTISLNKHSYMFFWSCAFPHSLELDFFFVVGVIFYTFMPSHNHNRLILIRRRVFFIENIHSIKSKYKLCD
jgi:hypothetical protein